MSKRPTDYLGNPAQGLAATAPLFVSNMSWRTMAETFGLRTATPRSPKTQYPPSENFVLDLVTTFAILSSRVLLPLSEKTQCITERLTLKESAERQEMGTEYTVRSTESEAGEDVLMANPVSRCEKKHQEV
jgi:hypothetical protein